LVSYYLRSGDKALHPLRHVYSGPGFTNGEIEEALKLDKSSTDDFLVGR